MSTSTMIDAPIACARGCLRWGYHASDCEQADPHTPGCIDEQIEPPQTKEPS